jgi:hypothetical protein
MFDDILYNICLHSDIKTLFTLETCNKYLNNVLKNDDIWKIAVNKLFNKDITHINFKLSDEVKLLTGFKLLAKECIKGKQIYGENGKPIIIHPWTTYGSLFKTINPKSVLSMYYIDLNVHPVTNKISSCLYWEDETIDIPLNKPNSDDFLIENNVYMETTHYDP